jgi:uncharacterized protein with ATP-grasp and redox domains
MNSTPPEIGMVVYKAIYQAADLEDPFKEAKQRCTGYLLKMLRDLRKEILSAPDSLYMALKFSGLGNAIDYGANPDFDLDEEMKKLFSKDFEVCEYDAFQESLSNAKEVLYLADNAGETVLDRLLIEQLDRPVKYAVRSKPIINDATIEDAQQAGIDEVADIISSGCDAPGTILDLCSEDFLRIFKDTDLIISKGQGNYETLSEQKRQIFFLLMVKCPVIARDINIQPGSLALIAHHGKDE